MVYKPTQYPPTSYTNIFWFISFVERFVSGVIVIVYLSSTMLSLHNTVIKMCWGAGQKPRRPIGTGVIFFLFGSARLYCSVYKTTVRGETGDNLLKCWV